MQAYSRSCRPIFLLLMVYLAMVMVLGWIGFSSNWRRCYLRAIWRRFDRLFDDARKDMERQNRAFDTGWREVSVLIDSLGDTLRSDAGNEITRMRRKASAFRHGDIRRKYIYKHTIN